MRHGESLVSGRTGRWTTPGMCVPLAEPRGKLGWMRSHRKPRPRSQREPQKPDPYSGIWWRLESCVLRSWSASPAQSGFLPGMVLLPHTRYRFKLEPVLHAFEAWLEAAGGTGRDRPIPRLDSIVDLSHERPPFNGLPSLAPHSEIGVSWKDLELVQRATRLEDVPDMIRAELSTEQGLAWSGRPDQRRARGARRGRLDQKEVKKLEGAVEKRLDALFGDWVECQLLAGSLCQWLEVAELDIEKGRSRLIRFLLEHPYVLALLDPADFDALTDCRVRVDATSSPVEAGLTCLHELDYELRYHGNKPRYTAVPSLPIELMRLVGPMKKPRERTGVDDLQARFALEVSLELGSSHCSALESYVQELRDVFPPQFVRAAMAGDLDAAVECAHILRKKHKAKGEDLDRVSIDKAATEFYTELMNEYPGPSASVLALEKRYPRSPTASAAMNKQAGSGENRAGSEMEVVRDPRRIRPWIIPDLGSRAFPVPVDQLPDPAKLAGHLDEWTRSPQAAKLCRLVTGAGLWPFRQAEELGCDSGLDASGPFC